MWLRKIILFAITTVSICSLSHAQGVKILKDSTLIYEKIETYSDRNQFTKLIYDLLFNPVAPDLSHKKKIKQIPHSSFEGKIIRKINIETLDPFNYSVTDTTTQPQNFVIRTGNSAHIKTRAQTIRNLLLIRRNQPFDPLLVKESERLIRSMSYVADVKFIVKAVPGNPDSVDIYIRELDKWSIIPGGSISDTRITGNLKENNFLGLGHEFHNNLVWNHSTNNYAYQTRYFVPNFLNTYVNSTLQYGTDENGNFIKSAAIDRPFFSPLAKWAAGIVFSQYLHNESILLVNDMPFKYNQQDYWAGNAFQIFKGNTEYKRTTNFISSARFIRTRFLEKPLETIDTLQFYTNENFYLASVGVSSRLYIQDKYIFKFGITEDIPIGKVISLTGGYQIKNNIGRTYVGGRYSSGNYYPWGYLSYNLEYGTYLRSSKTEQGVFITDVNYFTNLIEIGRWKLRQFIKPQLVIGLNRNDYDTLTINNEYGLRGFNSPLLSGYSRLLLTSQTQLYAPRSFIGFHFGPYFTFSLGMLGDEKTGFQSSKVYSQIGLGIIIKNDNLVINTFQLSLSFYPEIPGKGFNIFKMNSFQSADFGFRDFEIGKPTTVAFR